MGEIRITGTSKDDMIKIIKAQEGQLTYEVNGKQESAPIKKGDKIVVDLATVQGFEKDGDTFVVGENVDLQNYQLLVNGSRQSDLLAISSGARLGDVEVHAGDGDADVVQFGEGVRAKTIEIDGGPGKEDFVQVFNRYQDVAYRNQTDAQGNVLAVDPRFTDEAVKVKAEQEGISETAVKKNAGLMAEKITIKNSENVLVGSHTKAVKGMRITGGDETEMITLGDQVGTLKEPPVVDPDGGMNYVYIGDRANLKPVELKNKKGFDLVSVATPTDVEVSSAKRVLPDISTNSSAKELKRWMDLQQGISKSGGTNQTIITKRKAE